MKFGLIEHDFGDTRSIETNFVVVGGGIFFARRIEILIETPHRKKEYYVVYTEHIGTYTRAQSTTMSVHRHTHTRTHAQSFIHTRALVRIHTKTWIYWHINTSSHHTVHRRTRSHVLHAHTHTHAHIRARTHVAILLFRFTQISINPLKQNCFFT